METRIKRNDPNARQHEVVCETVSTESQQTNPITSFHDVKWINEYQIALAEGKHGSHSVVKKQNRCTLSAWLMWQIKRKREGNLTLHEYVVGTKEERSADKAEAGGSWFSFSQYRDSHRSGDNWSGSNVVVLDADAKCGKEEGAKFAFTRVQLRHRLDGLQFVALPTYSYTDDIPRWRIVVVLTEVITDRDEFRAISRAIAARLDMFVDPRSFTPEQYWFSMSGPRGEWEKRLSLIVASDDGMSAPFNVAEFRERAKSAATETVIQKPIKPRMSFPKTGPNILSALTGPYPLANAEIVAEQCDAVGWAVSNPADVKEPYWRDLAGIAHYCDDGAAWFHEVSQGHPNYDRKEAQTKFDGWHGTGATRCDTFHDHDPSACSGCEHFGKINSPIVLGWPGRVHASKTVSTAKPTTNPTTELSLPIEAGRLTLSSAPPPKRKWVVDKLLPLGTYAILAGLGGVSKTMLAISWAVHVALGKQWAELPVAGGAAMLILGEETKDEVTARFGAICRNMTAESRTSVMDRVLAFPWAGNDMRITELRNGNPAETLFSSSIINAALEHSERCGVAVKLIVIDHARLTTGGDTNDAEDVTEATRVMTKIANATGAAVVLIAHSPKTAITKAKNGERADAADVAGSIALVDNARAAMVLTTMREDEAKKYGIEGENRDQYAKLQLVKANYSRTGWDCWLKREAVPDYEVAVLLPVTLAPPSRIKDDAKLEYRILELVGEMPGQLSCRKLRDRYAGKKKALAASESDVEVAVDKLLNDGRLVSRSPTDDEKVRYGLTGNTRSVLVVA